MYNFSQPIQTASKTAGYTEFQFQAVKFTSVKFNKKCFNSTCKNINSTRLFIFFTNNSKNFPSKAISSVLMSVACESQKVYLKENAFKNTHFWRVQNALLPTAREGNVFRSVCQLFWPQRGRGVGFPACITGHMIRGSAYSRVCIRAGLHPGGSASQGGLHLRGVCISGESASRDVCIQGVCIQGGRKWVCLRGLGRPPPIMTSSGGHIGRHPTGMHSCC